MNQRKWVYFSFLAISIVLGYVLWKFLTGIAGLYDLETKIANVGLWAQGISLLFAGVLMLMLSKNSVSLNYMSEVIAELGKMVWPSQKDTSAATLVVVIMVLICGIILGLFDWVFGTALKSIIG